MVEEAEQELAKDAEWLHKMQNSRRKSMNFSVQNAMRRKLSPVVRKDQFDLYIEKMKN